MIKIINNQAIINHLCDASLHNNPQALHQLKRTRQLRRQEVQVILCYPKMAGNF